MIDNATHETKHTITFDVPCPLTRSNPLAFACSPTGARASVTFGPANRIAVADAQTFESDEYLLVSQRVWQGALSPDETVAYVTNGVAENISIIGVKAAQTVVESDGVGSFQWGRGRGLTVI